MAHALVFGGYGVFGALVARELARREIPVIVAGRDAAKADAVAAKLPGKGHRSAAADLSKPESYAALLGEKPVVINAAGPFQRFGTTLVEACANAGCHHVDIADDRGYVRSVRALDGMLRSRGVAAVFGCSSFPAISLSLARVARGERGPPSSARLTLFIGNDNAKGYGAIASAASQAGRRIEASQGKLVAFRGAERVVLPKPFGTRVALDYDAPEYDLLAAEGVKSVRVKVGFESGAATLGFRILGRMPGLGAKVAKALVAIGRRSRRGSSGGCVLAELEWPDGTKARASLTAHAEGQTMAALPAVIVAQVLCAGRDAAGAMTAPELLGASVLLGAMERVGFVRG